MADSEAKLYMGAFLFQSPVLLVSCHALLCVPAEPVWVKAVKQGEERYKAKVERLRAEFPVQIMPRVLQVCFVHALTFVCFPFANTFTRACRAS